jgi:hypothetical protein
MSTSHAPSRILVGIAATAGVFGAAAMMSAAAAPTSRADAFTDIINAVNSDYAYGQTDFTTAFADFSSNNVAAGLAALFSGIDDDSLMAPNNVLIGTVEALTNEPVTGSISVDFSVPASYADALTGAQGIFTLGGTLISQGAAEFGLGDYGAGLYNDLLGLDYLTVFPFQELLLGAAVSF